MIRARRFLWIAAPLFGLLAAAAVAGRPASIDMHTKLGATEVRVAAARLVAEYLADERAADARYRFKTVEVRGAFLGLDRSDPQVTVAVVGTQVGSRESPVVCQGGAALEQAVGQRAPGSPITVRGKFAGMVQMRMVLLNCELVR